MNVNLFQNFSKEIQNIDFSTQIFFVLDFTYFEYPLRFKSLCHQLMEN
jgi:hypothetical protein